MVQGVSKASPEADHLQLTVSFLWLLTPTMSTLSMALVLVAMTTNQWLFTRENMPSIRFNGTGDLEYVPKETISGLWTLCYSVTPGESEMTCSNIDYFPSEEYSPDPNDSTMAIPYTVTKSVGFFLAACAMLVLAEILCLCGHCSRPHRVCTFISGVVFIISGLFMLTGLVMYISILKAEIGGKLRPRSQLQPPLFTFHYGFSFILYVSGFVSTELSGMCAVFFYIYWHQLEWLLKREQKKIYLNDDSDIMYPLCRRHPEAYISSTNTHLLSPRRFYLEHSRETNSNSSSPVRGGGSCQRHCRQMLTEIINDESLFAPPQPPPEAYHYSVPPFHFVCVPRDVTTNTVSTMADIEVDDEDDAERENHEHEFIPFDMDDDSGDGGRVSVLPPPLPLKKPIVTHDPVRRTTPV